MRLLFVVLMLLTAGVAVAREKVIAAFASNENEQVTVLQEEKPYGLDLVFVKGRDRADERRAKRVRNAFGVALKNPSVIFLCSISNGHEFRESFQILNIKHLTSTIVAVQPVPMSDDLECLIEENEKYFAVLDDFPGAEATYLFGRDGQRLGVFKGKATSDIEIDGRVHRFLKVQRFGGFR